jgi:hypothetical protein
MMISNKSKSVYSSRKSASEIIPLKNKTPVTTRQPSSERQNHTVLQGSSSYTSATHSKNGRRPNELAAISQRQNVFQKSSYASSIRSNGKNLNDFSKATEGNNVASSTRSKDGEKLKFASIYIVTKISPMAVAAASAALVAAGYYLGSNQSASLESLESESPEEIDPVAKSYEDWLFKHDA